MSTENEPTRHSGTSYRRLWPAGSPMPPLEGPAHVGANRRPRAVPQRTRDRGARRASRRERIRSRIERRHGPPPHDPRAPLQPRPSARSPATREKPPKVPHVSQHGDRLPWAEPGDIPPANERSGTGGRHDADVAAGARPVPLGDLLERKGLEGGSDRDRIGHVGSIAGGAPSYAEILFTEEASLRGIWHMGGERLSCASAPPSNGDART